MVRASWSRARSGGQPDRALQHPGVHEGLGQVAPRLALADVVLLGVQAGRAAGRAVALEPAGRRGGVPAGLGDLRHPEPAQQERALALVQRPGVVAEPVHVPVLGELVGHRPDGRAVPRVVRGQGAADHRQQQGSVDARVIGRDLDRLIEEWHSAGQTCWIGVDASWTTDLTAIVAIFPPFSYALPKEEGEEGSEEEQEARIEEWTFLPFFWIPQERVEAIGRKCRVNVELPSWIEKGFVTATPGGAIDLRSVVERIKWCSEKFNLVEVPYDRMNFRVQAMDLQESEGINCTEVPQTFLGLSAATKFLLALYGEKQVRHGNHPVLNWMASCLQLQYDHKDNCQPAKPERMKSAKRIDGMQALVTGLSQAMQFEGESVYATRGPLVV